MEDKTAKDINIISCKFEIWIFWK